MCFLVYTRRCKRCSNLFETPFGAGKICPTCIPKGRMKVFYMKNGIINGDGLYVYNKIQMDSD
jgi:hypothetical protein